MEGREGEEPMLTEEKKPGRAEHIVTYALKPHAHRAATRTL